MRFKTQNRTPRWIRFKRVIQDNPSRENNYFDMEARLIKPNLNRGPFQPIFKEGRDDILAHLLCTDVKLGYDYTTDSKSDYVRDPVFLTFSECLVSYLLCTPFNYMRNETLLIDGVYQFSDASMNKSHLKFVKRLTTARKHLIAFYVPHWFRDLKIEYDEEHIWIHLFKLLPFYNAVVPETKKSIVLNSALCTSRTGAARARDIDIICTILENWIMASMAKLPLKTFYDYKNQSQYNNLQRIFGVPSSAANSG